jgi:hypothetical protein
VSGVRFEIGRADAAGAPGAGTGAEPGWYPRAVDTAIATSPDGQWIAVRQGAVVSLYTAAGEEAGAATLASSDADLAVVGPPITVVVVERTGAGDEEAGGPGKGVGGETAVIALAVPGLGETARVAVGGAHDLVATTGPRLALIGRAQRSLGVLRASGRAFMSQPCDPGGPVELVAGLDKNQLLVVMAKRLEIWDAVSCRPLLRPTFTLLPAPRRIGSIVGHVWCYQPGGTELVLYRLSDGRPFQHRLGSPIEAIASHPASPYLVAVTTGGILRIHAFAHSVDWITPPAAEAFAIAGASALGAVGPTGAAASDLTLVGATSAGPPWHQPIAAEAAPPPEGPVPTSSEAMEIIRTARDRRGPAPASPPERMPMGDRYPGYGYTPGSAAAGAAGANPAAVGPAWRQPLVDLATELVAAKPGDAAPELPALALGTSLSDLCQRAQLSTPARRAMTVLYGCHLIGQPIAIARLARLLGGDDGWTEALGAGELAERGFVTSRAGLLQLADPVARAIDGAPPRALDLVGDGPAQLVVGGHVVDPARVPDPVPALARALGRFGLATSSLSVATLEAFAHGLTAVALPAPSARVHIPRIPRGAGLLIVAARTSLPPSLSSWPTFDP